MKYKLINKTTGTEHFCIIVTVDGFDYYVNKETPKNGDFAIYNSGELIHYLVQLNTDNLNKVVATTNPDIDIPKVIDEVERIAMDNLKNKWQHLYQFGYPKKPYPTNYERDLNCVLIGLYKSQESHSNSDEDMIEFNEWCQNPNNCLFLPQTKTWYYKTKKYTSQELLNIWRKNRIKTVYFE